MTTALLALHDKIYAYYNTEEFPYNLEYLPRVSFSKIGDLYEIMFYGESHDDKPSLPSADFDIKDEYNFGFCALLDLLVCHAEKVASLTFSGPDAGANGMRCWNFERLVQSKAIFENLLSFKVALTDVGDHNQSFVGDEDDEGEMIVALVAKMPKLQHLEVPSSPNKAFFKLKNLEINTLVVQSGFEHLDFIKNLAKATNLKKLRSLDYFNAFEEDEKTPFEDYKSLFESKLLTDNFHFKLRESTLTMAQLKKLKRLNSIQFLHIKTFGGQYIES
jgi:hypothetical protein